MLSYCMTLAYNYMYAFILHDTGIQLHVCEHLKKLRADERPETVQHPGGHFSQYANHLIKHIEGILPTSLNVLGIRPQAVSNTNHLMQGSTVL